MSYVDITYSDDKERIILDRISRLLPNQKMYIMAEGEQLCLYIGNIHSTASVYGHISSVIISGLYNDVLSNLKMDTIINISEKSMIILDCSLPQKGKWVNHFKTWGDVKPRNFNLVFDPGLVQLILLNDKLGHYFQDKYMIVVFGGKHEKFKVFNDKYTCVDTTTPPNVGLYSVNQNSVQRLDTLFFPDTPYSAINKEYTYIWIHTKGSRTSKDTTYELEPDPDVSGKARFTFKMANYNEFTFDIYDQFGTNDAYVVVGNEKIQIKDYYTSEVLLGLSRSKIMGDDVFAKYTAKINKATVNKYKLSLAATLGDSENANMTVSIALARVKGNRPFDNPYVEAMYNRKFNVILSKSKPMGVFNMENKRKDFNKLKSEIKDVGAKDEPDEKFHPLLLCYDLPPEHTIYSVNQNNENLYFADINTKHDTKHLRESKQYKPMIRALCNVFETKKLKLTGITQEKMNERLYVRNFSNNRFPFFFLHDIIAEGEQTHATYEEYETFMIKAIEHHNEHRASMSYVEQLSKIYITPNAVDLSIFNESARKVSTEVQRETLLGLYKREQTWDDIDESIIDSYDMSDIEVSFMIHVMLGKDTVVSFYPGWFNIMFTEKYRSAENHGNYKRLVNKWREYYRKKDTIGNVNTNPDTSTTYMLYLNKICRKFHQDECKHYIGKYLEKVHNRKSVFRQIHKFITKYADYFPKIHRKQILKSIKKNIEYITADEYEIILRVFNLYSDRGIIESLRSDGKKIKYKYINDQNENTEHTLSLYTPVQESTFTMPDMEAGGNLLVDYSDLPDTTAPQTEGASANAQGAPADNPTAGVAPDNNPWEDI